MCALDDIASDDVIKMTPVLVRAFRCAGCDPACHCCGNGILVGDKFKLAEVKLPDMEATDQMLCDNCTPKMLIAQTVKESAQKIANRRTDGGHTRKTSSFTPTMDTDIRLRHNRKRSLWGDRPGGFTRKHLE